MSKIEEALAKRFQDHRIIFWYDEKQELLEQYQEMVFDSVELRRFMSKAMNLSLKLGVIF